MIARATGVLLSAYLLVAASGVLFITHESEALAAVAVYASTNAIWGSFYVIGGMTAATALVTKKYVKHTIPLWYFEVAGMSLIVAANVVYSYALFQVGATYGGLDVVAAGLIVSAFAASMLSRLIETLRLIRILKNLALPEQDDG